MAQTELFLPYGGVYCEANETYDSTNIPAVCNTVQLTRGVRITDGEGNDTRVRGCRVLITNNGATPASNPLPNTSFIWLEGDIIRFIAGASYKFLDSGMVTYGTMVVL